MTDRLSAIRIVLVSPKSGENVGAVCRAMKTMGVTDLRTVGEETFDIDRARIVAVHAEDVLAGRNSHKTVAEAVDRCVFVAGATRRWGKKRKSVRLTPSELAGRILAVDSGDVALVFGPEADGLSDDDLAVCHAVVTIPSSPEIRSLNLSHAVQICTYEIYRQADRSGGRRFYKPLEGGDIDTLVAKIAGNLASMGVAAGDTSRETVTLLRDVFARALLSRTEADRLSALFQKLAGMSQSRRSEKRD